MIYLIAGNQYADDFFNAYATNEAELKDMIVKYGKDRGEYVIPMESIKIDWESGIATFQEIDAYDEEEVYEEEVYIFKIPHEKEVVIKNYFGEEI